jgi:hypothetical protein
MPYIVTSFANQPLRKSYGGQEASAGRGIVAMVKAASAYKAS